MILGSIQFLIDELRDPDNHIADMVDNQIFSGLSRTSNKKIPPHNTQIGIEYTSDNNDGYFFTEFRDFDCKNIEAKITISSAYGENDNYCQEIINNIVDLFSKHRKKITNEYRIFIDKIQTGVIEENNERWTGTINMNIRQFTLIPDNIS